MSEPKTVGCGPTEVTCDELAAICKAHGKRAAVLIALRGDSSVQLVTYGAAAADKVEAHQIKEWIATNAFEGGRPPTTHHESFILDAAKVKEERDKLAAAANRSLGFVRYALEFWDWTRFPNLEREVEQLRDQLAELVPGTEPPKEGGA